MHQEIEITRLSRRFERGRMRNPSREKALLSSIGERGIDDPLYVTGDAGSPELLVLDGFKRLRCAEKLGLDVVPVWVLAENETIGVLKFMRLATGKGLHCLEEAHWVEVLHLGHGLSVVEIAQRLGRSPSWVRMRLGVLEAMSEKIKALLYSGAFPFRNWLYTVRARTRVQSQKEVETFVERVSGHGLSTRDIELLSKAWFSGGEALRRQVEEGKLEWTLLQLKEAQAEGELPPSAGERLLRELDILYACMRRAREHLCALELKEGALFERVVAKAGRVLHHLEGFQAELLTVYAQD